MIYILLQFANKMKNFAKRIEPIPTSIFATIAGLAVKHKAVNLGQGYPDFNGPEWLIEKAHESMLAGKNQYAPTNGILTLRQEIANYYSKYYNINYNPETEITVTAGATEALFSTIFALIENGDEVIMFEPFYDSYQANVLLAGGVPKYVTLHKPDFSFDKKELEQTITNKTKMIIVNTPHNPTGKIFSLDELNFIADLAKKHDLLVLSDEVYEFLTFDDAKHIPIASLDDMKERTITISSTGKTFGMTGWKVGYISAPPAITAACQKTHQFVTFTINTPGQHAMAYGLSRLETYLPEFRALYQTKRDYIFENMEKTQFKPIKSFGSYFNMVEIPEGLYKDDIDCAIKLIENNGIATIPPSVFYGKSDEGKSMIRLCFAKTEETIKAALERFLAI